LLKVKTEFTNELNTQSRLKKYALKLPENAQERWNRKATTIRVEQKRSPKCEDFIKFVKTEVDVATNPSYNRQAMQAAVNPSWYTTRGSSSGSRGCRSVASSEKQEPSCLYCKKDNHLLSNC